MGLLASIFRRTRAPLTPDPAREALFGDLPLEAWPPADAKADAFPWNTFILARSELAAGREDIAVGHWREVLAQPGLESRHYLQAWHFLRQHGQQPMAEVAKRVLGLVVEVGMPRGLDVLAAYADHSARYLNLSGGGLIWEHPDASLDPFIDDLLAASEHVVAQIGPWHEARPPAPRRTHARLSFLTPSGLHFGQGSITALSKDPLAGRVFEMAAEFMKALIAKPGPPKPAG